jgi:hypothetical protein
MAVRNSLTHTGGGGDTKGVARELDTSAPVFVFRLPPFLLFLFLSLNIGLTTVNPINPYLYLTRVP